MSKSAVFIDRDGTLSEARFITVPTILRWANRLTDSIAIAENPGQD